MKEFYLISFITIFIMKCEQSTNDINGKFCAAFEGVSECYIWGELSKYKCENAGCCFSSESFWFFSYNIKCFYPSCINGCENCNNLKTCLKCKENYYLTEDTRLCYDSLIEEYYIDGEYLKRCHSNCLTCYSSAINNNMNCISCKNGYYFLDGTNNCYDYSFRNKGYYLEDNNKFYPCNPNCSTCSDKKNDESNNCLSCDNS